MSAGVASFRAAEKHVAEAETALREGRVEEAKVHAALAESCSRLALAAATVVAGTTQANGYRMHVGGLDL